MIGDAQDLLRAWLATDALVDKSLGTWGKPCVIPGCGIKYTNPETDMCVWHDYQMSQGGKA